MRFSLLCRAKCRPGVVATPEFKEGRLRFQVIGADDNVLTVGRLQLIPLAVLPSLRCELDLGLMPTSSLPSENDSDSVVVEGVAGTTEVVVAISKPPNKPSTSLLISSRSSAQAVLASQSS